MGTITIIIPDELTKEFNKHPEIDWNEISKASVVRQIRKLAFADFLDEALEKSEFTEKDAIELGNKIKEARLKYLKEKIK